MGPKNRFMVIDVRRAQVSRGIERTEVVYPDGVEIGLKIPAYTRVADLREPGVVPWDAVVMGAWSDYPDEDGRTYCFISYWVPAMECCCYDCKSVTTA